MCDFKVVSLDMFQTLVNLDNRTIMMWKEILGRCYTAELAAKYHSILLSHYFDIVARIRQEQIFVLTKEIYRECFERVFAELKLTYNSDMAVQILVYQHTQAEFYEETLDFIEYVSAKYQVCIVSDTDEDMLPSFYREHGISLFASEFYQSYKNDHNNRMFREMIRLYGAEPVQILHIGDTPSDVLGAQRAGIQACWVNRMQQPWTLEQAPDYTVRTLSELKKII